jgi:flagellar motor switch protein FliG
MITDFIALDISKKDAATALTVLRQFEACESTEEWLMTPFSAWAKLKQMEEFLDHMVNNTPLKDDTLRYIAAHATKRTDVNHG